MSFSKCLFRIFLAILLSVHSLRANDPVLYIKVIRDTTPWYDNGWGGEPKNIIRAGTILYPQWSTGMREEYICYFENNHYYHGDARLSVRERSYDTIDVNDIELPGSDRLDSDILLKEWGDIIWIPRTYIDILIDRNRDKWFDLYCETNYYSGRFVDTGFAINDLYLKWRNGSYASATFVTKNIKRIGKELYQIYASTVYSDSRLPIFDTIRSYPDVFFFLEFRNNSIRIYNELHQEPFWELVKVKKELCDIIYHYEDTGQLPSDFDIKDYLVSDISKPWPLRNLKDIQAEFIPVRPANPTRKIIKQTSLYTLPYISSGEKITALAPNALVYELETGSYAILGKDKAPWLHVETKDGLRGWLWGGFTEIIEGSSSPNTTNFSTYPYTVTDNLRLRKTSDLKSEIVTTLPKNTRLALVSKGKTQTIDGITAPWVQVKTEAGETGWCFGGFLDPKP